MVLPPESLTNTSVAARLMNAVNEKLTNDLIQKQNLVYLELNGCSGNIISLLNGEDPDFAYALNSMVNLRYSNSLMVPEGNQAIEQLMNAIDKDFILAVEGAVALKNNGLYNVIGSYQGKPLTGLQAISMLGEKATI